MTVLRDAQGHPIAAASRDVADGLDSTIGAYLGSRADTRERLNGVLAADADCVMAHCLDGYLGMLASTREGVARARAALSRAEGVAKRRGGSFASARELMHLRALDAWSVGDMRGAADRWTQLLAEHPRDIVAMKVSQFVLSYLGESVRMRDTVAAALPSWDRETPGYGFVLGCYAYPLEETADYALAERMGREAVSLNPSDIWAAHAVAHVTEMQGRPRDGIAWVASLADEWRACGTFANHLRWHEALYNLELEEYDRVLELYDREVRAQPTDEYLDVANAVSLLWRLEQLDVDVGARWPELAERARAHMDDHSLVFVDAHYLMALAAAGSATAAEEFLASCERFAATVPSTEASVMAEVGIPLGRAVLAHRRGSYVDAVDALFPVRGKLRTIGASHAQRDLFEQLLIDAAWRGGRLDLAARLLDERTAARPDNLWGWKHRSSVLAALGLHGEAESARRAVEMLRERQAVNAPAA